MGGSPTLTFPDWLLVSRKAAQDAFNDAPVPPRGLHLWRYTDPNRFISKTNQITAAAKPEVETLSKDILARLKNNQISAAVIDNAGKEIQIFLSEELRKEVVVVSSLSNAVNDHRSLVEPHLYTLINSHTGKFESMNGANWQDGIFIYIPKGKTIEKPIELLRIASPTGNAYPRLLVVAEQNVECTIIDEYVGGAKTGDPSQTNSAIEIFGGQDSRIRYVQLQNQRENANLYLTHRGKIERNATMLTIPFSFGSAVSKQNFGVTLNGNGSESNMFGLLFGADHQHFDNHTLHHHTAGQTMSNIDFKVVLRDQALSAYTGLIRIETGARTCEAYQENRNLLLNPGTKAETIPELEILNEDVKCTHGATIGPIDPMQIFYLKSRGIENTEAVQMVVSGFVETTLKLIPADLRPLIGGILATKLEQL